MSVSAKSKLDEAINEWFGAESNLFGVSAQVEMISPAVAELILSNNEKNRPLNKSNLRKIATDMRDGNFHFNGEPIIISDEGKLLNGQHRLHAIIESKKTLPFMVVRGVTNEAFKTMDRGKTRSATDTIAVLGYKNASRVSTLARMKIALDRGDMKQYLGGSGSYVYSTEEIVSKISDCPEIYEAVSDFGSKWRNISNGFGNNERIAMFLILREKLNPTENGSQFLTQMRTKIGWTEKSPSYVLARSLENFNSKRIRSNAEYIMAIGIKAYNFALEGKEIRLLRYNPEVEEFPKFSS